jgi:hypothetical protein
MPSENTQSKPATLEDYICVTWFERDRKFVSLGGPGGATIFELWDSAVDEAVESGYLPTPRHPRPSDDQWLPCAIEYALSKKLIARRPQ